MRKKQASLNVSVEAIVVLVLAITMLGLGLAFIKNMFGGTANQLTKVSKSIEEQVINDLKSSDERIAFYQTEIQVKKGSKEAMFFGVKNDLTGEQTFNINKDGAIGIGETDRGSWTTKESVIACYDAIDDTAAGSDGVNGLTKGPHIVFATIKTRLIKQDEVVVLPLDVTATSKAIKTTYSCAIIIQDPVDDSEYARKDFFVTVV
jgi:hypothetical protein